MTLKQLRIAALTATFLTGTVALGYAQSSSTVGTGGSSSGTTGLDRADQVAGKHGAKGRANARRHHMLNEERRKDHD